MYPYIVFRREECVENQGLTSEQLKKFEDKNLGRYRWELLQNAVQVVRAVVYDVITHIIMLLWTIKNTELWLAIELWSIYVCMSDHSCITKLDTKI